MAQRWNQRQDPSLTVRLGRLAIRTQALVVAQRTQSIQRMVQAHTKALLKTPGGKRKLEEAQAQLNKAQQLLKARMFDGG